MAYTLGRHTNDWMTSFYSHTPSGFFVEYGWGGRVIDPATWQPHETFDGPSFWGHERLHMPPEERARLREMRLAAAARGVRAPISVVGLPLAGRGHRARVTPLHTAGCPLPIPSDGQGLICCHPRLGPEAFRPESRESRGVECPSPKMVWAS